MRVFVHQPQRFAPFLVVAVIASFALATAGGPVAAEQPPPSLDVTAIDAIIRQGIRDGEMPGAVVMIGRRDRIVLEKAYGHRQVEPRPLPMTTDTVFDLASLTKPIATATSVMILWQRGLIGLDDPVADHLPEFDNHGKGSITIRQLLLHVGGLIADNPMSDYQEGRERAIENLMQLEPRNEPGAKFRYSDVGFQILGELVRRVSGQDVHQFSQESVFVPLGMTETGYLPETSLRERSAPTERRQGQWMRGEVHDPRAFAMGGVAGHAGLFSTAADLSTYARMILGQGRKGEVQILRPDVVDQMIAARPVPAGIRGLGWDKQTGYSSNRGQSMSESAIGHGGFTGTALWIDPELDLFVIFLSNRLHPDGKGSVNSLAGQIGTIAADAVRQDRPTEADVTTKATR